MSNEIAGYRRVGSLTPREAAEVDKRMTMLDESIDNLVAHYRDYLAVTPTAIPGGTCPIEIAQYLDSVDTGQAVAMLVNTINRIVQLTPAKDNTP